MQSIASCLCVLAIGFWWGPVRAQSVFPGAEWETIGKAESVGFSSTRLAAVREWVASLDTTAMMVVVGGRVAGMGGSSARLGKGTILVVESDESDGSFLKLAPIIAVVTKKSNRSGFRCGIPKPHFDIGNPSFINPANQPSADKSAS